MSGFEKEPYTFMEALSYLMKVAPDPGLRPRGTGKNMSVKCPCCGESKFYFDATRNTGHCYRASCGFKGNQISYVAQTLGISNKEAYHLASEISLSTVSSFMQPQKEIFEPDEAASPEARDKANQAILEAMPLSDRHKKDLMERGVEEKDLFRFKYGSYRVNAKEDEVAFARAILNRGISLKGIAGVYTGKDGSRCLRTMMQGILIPYVNENRQILGFQIRKNNEDLKRSKSGKLKDKYICLSSNGLRGGAKCTGLYHFSFNWVYVLKGKKFRPDYSPSVLITEGALKADLIHYFSGENVIAIPGVNNIKPLKEVFRLLKENGVEEIIDCFDMDYVSNNDVRAAMDQLRAMVISTGLRYTRNDWPVESPTGENLKGYDDYLKNKRKK